ncbi:MAG: hypothetical protein ACKO1N_04330 [Erythrobacter sp.]
MKLGWLCAEKATAVSLGCAGLMLADGGLITGGVIASAGLLGLWSKACRADGVNSEKLLADARARLLKDFSGWAEGRDLVEADVIAADKAMERHLADCVPPPAELAKTTFDSEEFPSHAAHLVVERLAEKNPIFYATHPSRSPAAREFALLVMHSALTMAKEQPEFLQRLTQEIVLLVPQHLVRIAAKVDDIGAAQVEESARSAAADARHDNKLDAILAALAGETAPAGVPPETVMAIARRVAPQTDDVDAAVAQIHAALDELILLRDRAARGSNLGDLVDEALRRIAERNARNAFDEGAAAGEDAYAELMQRQKAERIALADAMIAQSRVRVDAAALARWEEERQRIETPDLTASGLFARIEEYCDTGLIRGEPLAQDVAIILAKRALEVARGGREIGAAQVWLGLSTKEKGARSGGADGLALLADAVAAYRAALEVRTRDALPAQWAMTQVNLALAEEARGDLSNGAAQADHWRAAEAGALLALEVYDPGNMGYFHEQATRTLARIRAKLAGGE